MASFNSVRIDIQARIDVTILCHPDHVVGLVKAITEAAHSYNAAHPGATGSGKVSIELMAGGDGAIIDEKADVMAD